MSEKLPIYDDEHGRVKDPGIAREAAEVEGKYRKKIFGIFPPRQKTVEKGELDAELTIEKAEEIDLSRIPVSVRNEYNFYIRQFCSGDRNDLRFKLVKIFKSDIGGGVTRYRFCGFLIVPEREEDKPIVFGPPVAVFRMSLGDQYTEKIITVDIKDGTVSKSEWSDQHWQ